VYSRTGSFTGGGGRKIPGADIEGHSTTVQVIRYEVPAWGTGELWIREGVVVNHDGPAARPGEPDGGHPLADRVVAYFGGARDSFADVELELDWCTEFQRAVVDALRAVPYGETVTYGELAALAGYPNAGRAAGSVCAQSRYALFVPCHRVVGADSLGSYGSLGLGYKRRLLELEGAL
jgi:methylated-DNA-[protein]-cysteine S-methyltransferase